jgi:hypothetical protein
VTFNFVIKEDGVVVYSAIETITAWTQNNAFNYAINAANVYVKSGSTYTFEFYEIADRETTIIYWTSYSLTSAGFSFTPVRDIPYKSSLNFANLFDVAQIDVFKDVVNQYGLTVQTNDLTKQIHLNPLDDLQANIGQAVDWSSKINFANTPTIKYKFGKYAQKNWFRYNPDDDVPANTGDSSFLLTDRSLPEELTVVQLNAAGVVAGQRLGNEHTPTIPFQTSESAFFDQKKSRILLLDKITKTINWQNTIDSDTGISTTLPLCYFDKDGKTDNLHFDDLLANNYVVLQSMLNQVKFLSAGFRLSEVDIANLDFTIPVFLDVHHPEMHINGYFFINKISNFKENSTTSVELIRI